MKTKNMGSKKKNRRREFEKRRDARLGIIAKEDKIRNAKTMEEMAIAMGMKLQ